MAINKIRRNAAHQTDRQRKAKDKLHRRLEQRKNEAADPSLRKERLKKNVPRTVENSRTFVGQNEHGETVDPRTAPVQLKEGDAFQLDLAGLEKLFPDQETLQMLPSTSQNVLEDQPLPESAPILLTTGPKPSIATHAALKELASLFGGPDFVKTIPRKNARFKLSKIAKWAAQRGFSALVVVGEDHGEISSLTLSKLPLGPTAHFRLTSFTPTRHIPGHGSPSNHAPELVLSNMTTPLGLSVGRLLQSLFPTLPQLEGRQVVAVHNQRDYIFFRRFRYIFNLRIDGDDIDDEERKALLLQRARDRGLDETFRTRMQEVGPRLTLKLRWIKQGTLEHGRRKASGTTVGAESARVSEEEQQQQADLDMLDADKEGDLAAVPTEEASEVTPAVSDVTQKRKRRRPSTVSKSTGQIKIPKLSTTIDSLNASNREGSGGMHRIKRRQQGSSILDGISFQGGMSDSAKEWKWDPSMQTKKNRFFL